MLDKTSLKNKLTDKSLLKDKAYVDGTWVSAASEKTFEVYNPSTHDLIIRVPDMSRKDAQKSIDAAYRAFPMWSSKIAKERAYILSKFHNLIMENIDDLANILNG